MIENLASRDRQREPRSVASDQIAAAIDSLMAQGMGEEDAIAALEDALQIQRVVLNLQTAQTS